MLANVTAGDDVWVKADGTYSRTSSTDALTNAGTAANPIKIEGYKTTIGDGYLGRTNGNGPLIKTNFAVITYAGGYFAPNKAWVILRNLDYSCTSNQPMTAPLSPGAVIECAVTNTWADVNARALLDNSPATHVLNCDLTCTTGTALTSGTYNSKYVGNRLSAGANAFNLTSNLAFIAFNTILPCAVGVNIGHVNASSTAILNNTFNGCTTAGIQILNSASATGMPLDMNNIFTNCAYARKSLYQPTGDLPLLRYYNRTRDNTNADSGFADWPIIGEVITDTGGNETDYVDAASNDYRLISASPAKGAMIPRYGDIGALQREESASGGDDSLDGGMQ